jgi:hypothetical protein
LDRIDLDRESQHFALQIWRQSPEDRSCLERISRVLGTAWAAGPGVGQRASWLVDDRRIPLLLKPQRVRGLRASVSHHGGRRVSACRIFVDRRPDAELQAVRVHWREVDSSSRERKSSSRSRRAPRKGILEAVLDCIITIDHRGRIGIQIGGGNEPSGKRKDRGP